MTIEEFKNLIKKADYLDDSDKIDILEMIPKMNDEHIKKLVTLILFAEQEKKDFETNRDLLISSLVFSFNLMNKNAVKMALKPTMEIIQGKQTDEDKKQAEILLNKLDDA